MLETEAGLAADFLDKLIRHEFHMKQPASELRVLDFGCGQGYLVKALGALGYEMQGCDVQAYWDGKQLSHASRLRVIPLQPYALPFGDNSFDLVVSTSVLEHVRNKEEVFREVRRVLKPGGYAVHQFPGKWYLPSEPHMKVPLANQLWPYCPGWWFSLWAWLGARGAGQEHMDWRAAAADNRHFYRNHLFYWTNGRYRRLAMEVFQNCSSPMAFYLEHGYGGYARAFRRLPFRAFFGWLSGQIRVNFLVMRKNI